MRIGRKKAPAHYRNHQQINTAMTNNFFYKAQHVLSYNGALSQEENMRLISQIIASKALSDTAAENLGALSGIIKAEANSESIPAFDTLAQCANERPESLIKEMNNHAVKWNSLLLKNWAIFQQISSNVSTELLAPVIDSLQSIQLRIDTTSAAAFMDEWIKNVSESFKTSNASTPADVAKLIAKIISPQMGESVYDPCTGLSSLLIATTQEEETLQLYGQEINPHYHAVSLINCLLHGKTKAQITCASSIVEPFVASDGTLMQFDKIVAEPPMGMRMPVQNLEKDEYKRFNWGLTARSRSEWLFFFNMLAHCRTKQGKLIIMIPTGLLYAIGNEQILRKQLIEKNLIDAVIALPPKILYNTSVAAALLIIDKRRESGAELENRKDVLFINASNMNNSKRGRAALADVSIERIVNCYTNRTVEDEFSYLANLSEITEKDFDLSPDVYTCPPPVAEQVDTESLAQEIKAIEETIKTKQQKLEELLAQLN